MWVSEQLLYQGARLLYRSEAAHSQEMKDALADQAAFDAYRAEQADHVLTAAARFGVEIAGRDVLDLGCNDGAISGAYLDRGAASVVGVDIDAEAIRRAQAERTDDRLAFHACTTTTLPLADASVDAALCYDVFEHVSRPEAVLDECARVLRPGGKLLIGTWGWRHPYAPHLWATMPVPWAHVAVSERTLLRACRRVYHAPWYRPNMHDLDAEGNRLPDKYTEEAIDPEYLNKRLVSDFERLFEASPFSWEVYPEPFGSKYARWTGVFLKTPWLREFITAYLWAVLTKPER